MNAEFPVHYLPNIHYFSRFLLYDKLIIDDSEGFERQSFRNRCYIAGANGKMALIVPVQNRGNGQQTRHVKIDNSSGWQRVHWQSIRSAYGRTPFFEHYADAVQPYFTRKYESLFDFDFELLQTLTNLAGLPSQNIILASDAKDLKPVENAGLHIHPKTDYALDAGFHPTRYIQAFEERTGFLPNLSIIDALCNMGPDTVAYLQNCVKPGN